MTPYLPSPARYSVTPYRRTGKSGLKLPLVSLGLWHNFGDNADRERDRAILRAAFDGGITHFDLANNYGPPAGSAERRFGELLREDFLPYRDELVISTKAGYLMWDGPYGDFGSRKYLLASLDQSLLRMGLDYVDIFYHHRMDPDTPLEETMGALDTAVRQGKALYVGLSNYDGETLRRAAAILREMRTPFIINQNRYNLLDRKIEENGLLRATEEEGLGLITFSPLAQGLLTDRYLNGIPEDSRVRTDGRFLRESSITEETVARVRRLDTFAKERGCTLAELSLLWILSHRAVTSVLVGASRPEQVTDDLGVANLPALTEDELREIDRLLSL